MIDILFKFILFKYNPLGRLILFIINKSNIYSIPESNQNLLYKSIHLDRKFGKNKLNEILMNDFKLSYDENIGMFSEHLLLLSSISKKYSNFKSILEIGTFDGKTALILSRLFPKAKINTIDLDMNENSFSSTYDRSKTKKKFIFQRNKILKKDKKISLNEMNSIRLCRDKNLYDLIWIDGAHGYPVIAMDLINSVRLIKKGGFILIDDVWTTNIKSDKVYKSVGSFESLNEIKKAKLINDFFLIPKRLSSKNNLPGRKKYVGIIKNS